MCPNFFFSSRRRHTRFKCDWSSDVCSSDLTKDASMPGEYGQVGSYIIGAKMVLPNGDLLEVTEEKQPDLMQKVRSSYGMFGVIYEVTYSIRPLLPLDVHHKTFTLTESIKALPDLKPLHSSTMFYIFPFDDRITIAFRKYHPGPPPHPTPAACAPPHPPCTPPA